MCFESQKKDAAFSFSLTDLANDAAISQSIEEKYNIKLENVSTTPKKLYDGIDYLSIEKTVRSEALVASWLSFCKRRINCSVPHTHIFLDSWDPYHYR